MMKLSRRSLLLGLALSVSPFMAEAQSALERSVRGQLERLGYRSVEVSRTLLGRTRFVAQNATQRREIVVNPSTGAILRDFTILLRGDGDDVDLLGDPDDDDDDDDDDDGGRDNSGKGSSNSGSGNGGGDDDDDDDDD